MGSVFTAAYGMAGPGRKPGKSGIVVILGFDGVDPDIVETMLAGGELPHMAKLRNQGCFKPLGTSNPPMTPTAWSSFITCRKPGNHGIYDILRREPATYQPSMGFGIVKDPILALDGSVLRDARYVNYRHGDSFWTVANRQGAKCKVFVVPYAYPVDDLSGGRMLCGLDVPDIRGRQSWFYVLTDAIDKAQDLNGGTRLPLKFQGDTATVMIPGVRHPRTQKLVEVPLTVDLDRTAHTLTLHIQGRTVTLPENTWSDWLEWIFQVTTKFAVRAISRFHLFEAADRVRLFMSCLQFHPREPYVPISSPPDYAAELADRYGLYKTIGWAYDTKAVKRNELHEDLFLDDVRQTMAWRERLMLDELKRGRFDLLIAAWTGTDRVSHLFWRFRDPKHPLYTDEGAKKYGRAVEETYMKMDDIIGKTMAKLNRNDLLMIMSDHGFHSFRTGFSVNTWLVRNGYLTVKGKPDRATAYTYERYLFDYDWSRTKAYGLGMGAVFLNLKGREGLGTVSSAEAPALLGELRDKLLAVTDPATGEKVFRAVYDNAAKSGAHQNAPDIQLGFAEGYQMDKLSAAGAAPKRTFSPNLDKWSGEHAASDPAITHGIFFANKPFTDGPRLIDIGVTALAHLGLETPDDFQGHVLK